MATLLGELCLTATIIVPVASTIISIPRLDSAKSRCRIVAGFGWLTAGLAIITAVTVAISGPFTVTLANSKHQPIMGLLANQFTVTLLVLVCIVGAIVQSFSVRYLLPDQAAHRFFAAANMVIVSMAIVCTSATVTVLIVAWITAGLSFVMVVGYRSDLPEVRTSTLRTLKMFALGDLALIAALVIIVTRFGNVDLVSASSIQAASERLGSLSSVVALLIMIAALTRSAQGPLGRWLPSTVSAPTPVSALLHAGVVNGGGILLIRLSGLASRSTLSMVIAFTISGLTATIGTALMTRKPDVKGSLAYSTIAQMGFMIAECTVGAYLAALVHLIGHAMYKATLFFGSGSQIPRVGQAPIAPYSTLSRMAKIATTVATSAAAIAVMIAIPGVTNHRGGIFLLIFTMATIMVAVWSWWNRRPVSPRLTVLLITFLLGAGALYGLVLGTLGSWIAPALPAMGAGILSPWWLLALVGVGLAMDGLTRIPRIRRLLLATSVSLGAPPIWSPKSVGNPNRPPHLAKSHDDYGPEVATSWTENLA